MKTLAARAGHRDGRDEMNLADFPISALQRAQKTDGAGGKLDRLELTASRYDPATRGRVRQKVTLTSTARDGLPTPADEHVILALLYVAKHGDDFAGDTVRFAPSQLFEIMGWAPNGRSYTRLRDVLRRLKSLTIRYENAWWDMAGRAYEEEVATGIVSGYRIARQVSGPRRATTALQSWVTWSQQFHGSLKAGNLKRLNLEVFFQLSTPTAQRLYRFLDKRFYSTSELSLDLIELACGHVGLAEVNNVAILKRRLGPAIAELEKIGFVQAAPAAERFVKVKAGQWRVVFRAAAASPLTPPRPPLPQGERGGPASGGGAAQPAGASPDARLTPPPLAGPPLSPCGRGGRGGVRGDAAADLALAFYRLWSPDAPPQPGPRDLEHAAQLLADHPHGEAHALLAPLVQITRKEWPACRSFSGAVQKYLAAAVKLYRQQEARTAARAEALRQRDQARQEQSTQQAAGQGLDAAWAALPLAQQEQITQAVRQRVGHAAPAAFVRRLCLEELGRRGGKA